MTLTTQAAQTIRHLGRNYTRRVRNAHWDSAVELFSGFVTLNGSREKVWTADGGRWLTLNFEG